MSLQTWAYYLNNDGTEILGTDGAKRLDSRMSRQRQVQEARKHIEAFKAVYPKIAGFFIEVGEGPNRRNNTRVHHEITKDGRTIYSYTYKPDAGSTTRPASGA